MGTGIGSGRRARRPLSLVSAALLAFGACLAYATGAGQAVAAPVEECSAVKGAVVAVDFGPFGGKVERGCDPTPTTGYELLREAGFGTEGTQHDGPGFLCRIGYQGFHGGKRYPTPDKEKCVLTPQATAYWSYWVAPRGQDHWSYSNKGAMARELKPGEVDAWVFGGTDVAGTTGKPTFTPDDVRAKGGEEPDPGGGDPQVPPGRVDVPKAARWLLGRLTDGERVVDPDAEDPNLHATTEAAFALASAKSQSPELSKVTAFLSSPATTTGYGWPDGADQPPNAAALARLALVAQTSGGDPRAFGGKDLIATLSAQVCATGPGAGCTAPGDFVNASSAEGQAHALLALERAGVRPPAPAVRRLVAQQCPNGGFSYVLIREGENCDPDPGTSALAALVLKRAGGQDATVAKALAYLKKEQRPDGSYLGWTGAPSGSSPVTAAAAQALRALGERARAEAAVAWLSRQQRPEGGFGFEDGADTTVNATAPVLLADAGTSLVELTARKPGPGPKPTEPGPEPTKPGPKPTTPGPKPTKPAPLPGQGPDLARGVAYLTRPANLQRGVYYFDISRTVADHGLTIDGAFALAATGEDPQTLRRIVDFLDGLGKDPNGKTIRNYTGLGTEYPMSGKTGKTALLAEVVGRDPRNFGGQDLIAGLGKLVCEARIESDPRKCAGPGAYTYVDSVFGQSLGIMAQLRAGETKAAEAPVAYLLGIQDRKTGAWPSIIPSTGNSDVDSTAMAAMAVDLAGGERAERAVDKALAFLAGKQQSDGGFLGASDTGSSVNSTALAIQGFALDAGKYRDQIIKARKFLAGQQNKDGGFTVAAGEPGSDIRASAQAVSGAEGISFATLTGDLTGTVEQPPGPAPSTAASAPVIVTPGDTGGTAATGGGTGATAQGGSGSLAATGVRVGALAALAALLSLAGWWTVAYARRQRTAHGER
ncbi:prenyltransferase/squalene oxidase repeat-containing protein [Streptomyces lichenis]|uniref:Peptidase n=1 Tax=Streptomyces lichenis TaxID=2306967 RepID=A0ABT0I8H8_9ACTN|nr:prenyltransferase/squalene oxidase repeat-containing protein [Streptomyces lichenis]MCK8677624.1 peptidase [Streptomyces lichenis]